MRLADFVLSNIEQILEEWEKFARSLAPGSEMSVVALRDHAEDILRVTARDMLSAQTDQQQSDKSQGHGGGGSESDRLDRASRRHAVDRVQLGFNLMEVVSEYRALRASVLRLWREAAAGADAGDLQDVIRFNESLDQSLAEAVRSYTTRVDESRELFLATLGHDLRAPLTAIMVSAELVASSEQLDDQNREIAAQIGTFGKTMTRMIHDLLEFTRTRLGAGMPVSAAPVDLRSLCSEVLEEFRAAYPDHPVHFEPSGDTSGEWDAARLRQVLSNLVANAIQHGAPGDPIQVSAKGDGSQVVLEVRNHGHAIAPAAIPTLFDPFVRLAPRSKKDRVFGGVGLGLYIAREIVAAHGGTIEVDSSDSAGTLFRVRLPRKPPDRLL